jgi:drug/metabolite transporter (DMT)-like permease
MRWTLWLAFVVLCVLSGTSWAIPREMSDELPVLEQQGIVFAVLGVIALVFAGGRGWSRSRWPEYMRLAAAAVGFFAVPMVITEYARGSVPAISRSALFALVPVVVVMVVAAGEAPGREERGARLFLMPALGGLGGLLLLLPLQFSGSTRGWMMLAVVCAAVVLVGLASVRLYRLLRGFGLAEAVAVVGLANAVFLLVWSAVRGDVVWRSNGVTSMMSTASISSLVDVVEVWLIVWLLREMPPARFAARYLVIPLLTVLESFVLTRPEWTVRMVFGTVLLAAGAGALLFWRVAEEEMILSLR